MGGIKRKEAPVLKHDLANGYKKTKTAEHNIKKTTLSPSEYTKKKSKAATKIVGKAKAPAPEPETVTDSDPIVESDTPEYSGEDDGEIWPSADEDDDEGVRVADTKPDRPLNVVGVRNGANEAGNSEISMNLNYHLDKLTSH